MQLIEAVMYVPDHSLCSAFKLPRTFALNADEWFRRGRFMLSAPLVSDEFLAHYSRAIT